MKQKSAFINTFGDYPLIRILNFLIYSRDFDYPITEIAENSNINFQTLKKLWPKLEQDKTIIKTRTLSGKTLYKINTNNHIVQKLIELNNFLIWETAKPHKKSKEKIRISGTN